VSRSPDDEDLMQDLQDSLAAACAARGARQPSLRDRMRRRTLELAREQAPEGTRTLRSEALWIEIAPFVEVRELRRDEVAGTPHEPDAHAPGRLRFRGIVTSAKRSSSCSKASATSARHRLVGGDVHIAPAVRWHEPVTTQTGVARFCYEGISASDSRRADVLGCYTTVMQAQDNCRDAFRPHELWPRPAS
jgi:hypothetical protein